MFKTNFINRNSLQPCSIYNATSDVIVLPSAMVATSDIDRQLGFQFWPVLHQDDAILFIFENDAIRSMHMQNVYFPLLMVWMDSKHIVTNVVLAEPSNTLLYSSLYPSQFCLECHPSLTSMFQVGDIIKFFQP